MPHFVCFISKIIPTFCMLFKRWIFLKIKANDYKANDLIKFIREYTGLTQQSFGEKIKRSRNAIQLYENGQRNYDVELLLKIAQVFNLNIIIESKKND